MSDPLRYVIKEGKPIADDTRTFNLTGNGIPDYSPIEVWGDNPPRCTRCSGQLVAMLTTCLHARAVRRFLKRAAPSRSGKHG